MAKKPRKIISLEERLKYIETAKPKEFSKTLLATYMAATEFQGETFSIPLKDLCSRMKGLSKEVKKNVEVQFLFDLDSSRAYIELVSINRSKDYPVLLKSYNEEVKKCKLQYAQDKREYELALKKWKKKKKSRS